MDSVSVLDVIDRDSEQNAQVIVRSVKGYIALTLTLEHEGDVQVVLSPGECDELISRLQQAVFDAQSGTLVTSKPTQSGDLGYSRIEELNLDSGGKVKHG